MSDTFYVELPDELRRILGEPDPGTRIFRTYGNQKQYSEWFDAISHHIGPTVSPGGAANRVHVSRAAVHKRMKAGKLTAFLFYAPENNDELPIYLRLFRKPSAPYGYIPFAECVAWTRELAERGTGSLAAPGPDDDDPYGHQLLEPPKAIKQQLKRIGKAAKGKKRE